MRLLVVVLAVVAGLAPAALGRGLVGGNRKRQSAFRCEGYFDGLWQVHQVFPEMPGSTQMDLTRVVPDTTSSNSSGSGGAERKEERVEGGSGGGGGGGKPQFNGTLTLLGEDYRVLVTCTDALNGTITVVLPPPRDPQAQSERGDAAAAAAEGGTALGLSFSMQMVAGVYVSSLTPIGSQEHTAAEGVGGGLHLQAPSNFQFNLLLVTPQKAGGRAVQLIGRKTPRPNASRPNWVRSAAVMGLLGIAILGSKMLAAKMGVPNRSTRKKLAAHKQKLQPGGKQE